LRNFGEFVHEKNENGKTNRRELHEVLRKTKEIIVNTADWCTLTEQIMFYEQ
jgi:hypothetical protein